MCFRKNKFEELKREEIVDTLCVLEREESSIEDSIKRMSDEIKALLNEGKSLDTNLDKVFVVKKISNLNEKRQRAIKNGLFVLYNIKMAERLKDMIDSNLLVNKIKSLKGIDCLNNQRDFAIYLNKALNTKTKEEDILTKADDMYNTVCSFYNENLKIYGISDMTEDKLMALFDIESFEDSDIPASREEH